MLNQYELLYQNYYNVWSKKPKNLIEKEIKSWQRYFDKHGQAYSFHGADMTPPNTLSDGDKIVILKEILQSK